MSGKTTHFPLRNISFKRVLEIFVTTIFGIIFLLPFVVILYFLFKVIFQSF